MTENKSLKELCQREAFILGLFLCFQEGLALGLSALHMDSAFSGDVWGFVTLGLKIQDILINLFYLTEKQASCLQWHGVRMGTSAFASVHCCFKRQKQDRKSLAESGWKC